MTDEDLKKTMSSVAVQLMSGDSVVVAGKSIPVRRVGCGMFRAAQFQFEGRSFEAIEQNPDKPSPWGKLAREKHQVVQFRDLDSHKYVAAAVDGSIRPYGNL